MKVIKYHNSMNKLKLGSLSENEIDIFFSLIFNAKETKQDIISIKFSELKKLASLDKKNDRLIKNILGLNTKLKAMNQTMEIEKGVYLTFSLFGDILTDTNKKILEVPINPRFRYLIDDLIGNFTIFDLKELISLKGSYAKTLFRLLKQWETTNQFLISMEEFREILDVPETYEQRNINQKILNPCLIELNQFFPDLKVEKLKNGKKIDRLKFTWKKEVQTTPQKSEKKLESYQEYQILQEENEKEKIMPEKAEETPIIPLTEEEEKKALEILGNESFFRDMKRKTEKIYWTTLRGILKNN